MARQSPMPASSTTSARAPLTIDELDLAAAAQEAQGASRTSRAPRRAGGGLALAANLAAVIWVLGVAAGAVALLGVPTLLSAGPLAWLALACAAIAPAMMVGVAGSAAREGAQARAEAHRLATAYDQMLNPSPTAEAAARRLGVSVRGEIAALEKALEQTLIKVREVEAVIARQTLAVDEASGMARQEARAMVSGLEAERAEMLALAQDLRARSTEIGETIQRHTRLIADAARVAETGVRSADETLEARLTSFAASAALINDRTAALQAAARASAESAARLEGALGQSLDSLTKATALTDAARQSADAATLAANATAGAVRETTSRAVEEARKAAELIRGEAAQMARDAEQTLDRMREAGIAARGGPQGPRRANPDLDADQDSVRRLPQRPAARSGEPARSPEPSAPIPLSTRRDPASEPLAPPVRPSLQPLPPLREERTAARASPQDSAAAAPREGAWTWRDLLSGLDEDRVLTEPGPARGLSQTAPLVQPAPAVTARAPAPSPLPTTAPAAANPVELRIDPRLTRGPAGSATPPAAAPLPPLSTRHDQPMPSARPSHPGLAVLEAAGVRVESVFSTATLDRIAHRARNGTQARRRAVKDAAPEAVAALARTLADSAGARADAASFLRADGAKVAELLGRGRANMTADATLAFLVIDAASS